MYLTLKLGTGIWRGGVISWICTTQAWILTQNLKFHTTKKMDVKCWGFISNMNSYLPGLSPLITRWVEVNWTNNPACNRDIGCNKTHSSSTSASISIMFWKDRPQTTFALCWFCTEKTEKVTDEMFHRNS